ncbi:MAG: peptidase M19 [Alphaproteobacteria bacterium]|nr:peptidase M19 [Alphaproteobacteria bacterium]
MLKWIGGGILILAAIGAGLFFFVIPARVDARMNVVIAHEPFEISAAARALHATIGVADLHADTMLWMRDPLKRHARGHVDLPRLKDGGAALQVFTAVTKTPSGLNYDGNDSDTDDLTALMIAERWPVATWGSLFARADYQAGRLADLERRANGAFIYVKTAQQLRGALAANALAGIYGIEGAHPLEGELDNIDRLYQSGMRVMGLQHFFDNALGGSLHGRSGAGLTPFGRDAVKRAIATGVIIDVAHSSEAVVRDVLAISARPLIVSHTGLKGHCDSPRNISDALMKEVADAGGLVGVGFWEGAICNPTPDGIAGAIVYAVGLLGTEHVALGSDFDGAVTAPFDASELAALTQALINAGLDDQTIRAVMGENAIRFFLENLPAE